MGAADVLRCSRQAAAAIACAAAIAASPTTARAAAAVLVDQTGRAFTLSSLRGEALIVTFVAARCTQACPLINARFAQAQARFARDGVRARLLTITLEPERDTPAVMRDLARRFHADSRRWLLATGRVDDVNAIVHAFGVRTGDEHTTLVYVFDARGSLREEMLASSALDRQLDTDLLRLQRSR